MLSMRSTHIRKVPNELHLQPKHRAKSKGQILQQYLLQELPAFAERPTTKKALKPIPTSSLEQVDMEFVGRDLEEERRQRT